MVRAVLESQAIPWTPRGGRGSSQDWEECSRGKDTSQAERDGPGVGQYIKGLSTLRALAGAHPGSLPPRGSPSACGVVQGSQAPGACLSAASEPLGAVLVLKTGQAGWQGGWLDSAQAQPLKSPHSLPLLPPPFLPSKSMRKQSLIKKTSSSVCLL